MTSEEELPEEGADAIAVYSDANMSWSIQGGKEQTINAYHGTTFDIGVKVDNPEAVLLHYKWEEASYLGKDEGYSEYTEMEDELSESIRLEYVCEDLKYRCTVSDDFGHTQSQELYIKCTNTLRISTENFQSVSAKLGGELRLSVEATSTVKGAKLTYKWGQGNYDVILGTGKEFVKKNFTADDAWQFYGCQISDGYSTDTVSFYAVLDSGLRVQAPGTVAVEKGETKTFSVSVTTEQDQKNLKVSVYQYDPIEGAWTELKIPDLSKISVTGTGEVQGYWIEASDGITDENKYIAIGPKALLSSTSETVAKAKTLTAGTAATAVIYGEAESAYFKFVPKKAGIWRFYSTGVYDTGATLYNANMKQIDCDDQNGEGLNFKTEIELKANETYYLETSFAGVSYDAYGSFPVYAELVSQKNCQHQWGKATVRQKATCLKEGISVKRCSICGEEISSSIPKTGHSYGAYQVKKAPTALAAGIKTRICKVCGHAENDKIAKLKASVTLSATSIPLQVNQTVSLDKLIKSMTKGDKLTSCTFAEKDKKIVTLNKIKVTGKKAGNVKITMKFASGITKQITVKVQKSKVAASSISNVPGSITLKVKKTYKLSPVIAPVTSKDKAAYQSANSKIATVSKTGVITAKKAGNTTITVKVGKKTKKIKVVVKK